MKLEDQVVSLELAKKLKELGVKQESLFWWLELYQGPDDKFNPRYFLNWGKHQDVEVQFSAFTVAELGEMLPAHYIDSMKLKEEWFVRYAEVEHNYYHSEFASTEANARAKMLIYLIENNLITL
jgi:hypothetical protein